MLLADLAPSILRIDRKDGRAVAARWQDFAKDISTAAGFRRSGSENPQAVAVLLELLKSADF